MSAETDQGRQMALLEARAAEGDRDAVSDLIEAYRPELHGRCKRLLGDWFDAEDAAQEATWVAFAKYDSRRGASVRTFLFTVGESRCRDMLRKRRRRKTVPLQEIHASIAEDGGTPVGEGLTRRELWRAVNRCLGELTEEEREVFRLKVLGDRETSYRELGEKLRRAPNTMRARFASAQGKLQECLKKAGVVE